MDTIKLEQWVKEGKTIREISELTNLHKNTVVYWLAKSNLSTLVNKQKVLYKDEHMFNKIDTKEKAYIIGYYLADGYGSDKNIQFGCALRDRELLDFIADYIGTNVAIKMNTNREARIFPSAQISIGNKNIRTDFLKHGGLKATRRIPIINKKLERYLVQGFFDGDGCISWGVRKDRYRIWQKIGFTSSLKLLEGIQNILLKQVQISTRIKPKGTEKCFVLDFSNKKDVLKFLDYIYPDDDFIILKRKYIKANALRLELGEFGEGPLTPSKATEAIAVECVETSS